MKLLKVSLLLILFAASSTAVLAEDSRGDREAGKNKSANCMGCHGVKGYFNVYPTYRVPKLGGQSPEYIVTALKAYQQGKDGSRDHGTMHAQAAQLSEQDMRDIAAFLSQHGAEEQ